MNISSGYSLTKRPGAILPPFIYESLFLRHNETAKPSRRLRILGIEIALLQDFLSVSRQTQFQKLQSRFYKDRIVKLLIQLTLPQNYCPALCETRSSSHIVKSRQSPRVLKKISTRVFNAILHGVVFYLKNLVSPPQS